MDPITLGALAMRLGLAGQATDRYLRRLEHLRGDPCGCDICERAAIIEYQGNQPREVAIELAARAVR